MVCVYVCACKVRRGEASKAYLLQGCFMSLDLLEGIEGVLAVL